MSEQIISRKDLSDKYEALSYKEKNEILYEALGVMQKYNGRTVFDAIAEAMGYCDIDGDSKTYKKYKRS
jgi:hypothetical protein